MSVTWGGQNEVGRIRRLALKDVSTAVGSQQAIQEQWAALNYTSAPDFARAVTEYDQFADLLTSTGVEIEWLPGTDGTGMDSLYVHDSSVVCDAGAILCNMGKEARGGEPRACASYYSDLGIPVVGAIGGEGRLEGGDIVWIGSRSMAVGRGYRTNDEGIAQLRTILGDLVDELVVVPLPHWRGEADVFHLMSVISPIDRDLALVYSPLMPVPFREWLLGQEMELVEVPDEEFESLGCNVLAVSPRQCVAVEGNPVTRKRLEAAGAEVHVFDGSEICAKGGGGPTCLTRPILRDGV